MEIDLIPFYYTGCETLYDPSDVCFLIDVYRASSMVVALAQRGAERFFLTAEVQAALCWKERHPEVLLYGERGGVAPPGFDGGNSPTELENRSLTGKTVVLTTTNGTRAAAAFWKKTGRLFALSLVNFEAAVSWVERNFVIDGRGRGRVTILCAGTRNRLSLEDFGVGALFWRTLKRYDEAPVSDEKTLAEFLAPRLQDESMLRATLHHVRHAMTLRSLGFSNDLDWILSPKNRFSVLPELHLLNVESSD